MDTATSQAAMAAEEELGGHSCAGTHAWLSVSLDIMNRRAVPSSVKP
jgi:hypothetical protein